jgi:hypothetical protein
MKRTPPSRSLLKRKVEKRKLKRWKSTVRNSQGDNMSKQITIAAEYQQLASMIAKYGISKVQDMVEIANSALGVTPTNLAAAIIRAKDAANVTGRNIAILFSPIRGGGEAKYEYAAPGISVSSHCIIMTVSPEGELTEGEAAQATEVNQTSLVRDE